MVIHHISDSQLDQLKEAVIERFTAATEHEGDLIWVLSEQGQELVNLINNMKQGAT